MDLQASVQLLGNLGEFIAAIAVVVTLIYLAAQVKQGKAALDANTQAMEREYELKAQEALKTISESVSQAARPKIQDAEVAQIWLDGLNGEELGEVDDFRFGSMMHETIWQGASMYGRMLTLGRSDLARSYEQITAIQTSQYPGFKKHWDLNRENLTLWGFDDLVQAVEIAQNTETNLGKSQPLIP
jgi:hypothetical protein